VGTCNFNRPADLCKLKSSEKIQADPAEDFSKSFTVNRKVSIVDVRRFIFLERCRLLNAHCTPLKAIETMLYTTTIANKLNHAETRISV